MLFGGYNYMRGYVTIQVSGFSVERFINLAAYRKIYLWDIRKEGASALMNVSAKAFKELRPCAKKAGCKVKIMTKHGIPFLMFRYRKRRFLLIGSLFFIAALYALSSFIWKVEVIGVKRLAPEDVVQYLSENGIKPGRFKLGIDDRECERALLGHFPDIAWTDIEIKGTKLTAYITEGIVEPVIIDRSKPCDILASKNGLIVTVATSSGTPLVKPGDVALEGSVLVSSEVFVGTPETGYESKLVHAESDVRAKIYHELEFYVPYKYNEKIYTGNITNNYSIIAFNKQFNFLNYRILYDEYDKISSNKQLSLGESYPLPLEFSKDSYREYITLMRERTVQQAMESAERLLNRRLISEFDSEAEISGIEREYGEEPDGLRMKAIITTIEKIGVASYRY